jgi:hypothetical protein
MEGLEGCVVDENGKESRGGELENLVDPQFIEAKGLQHRTQVLPA